jgi:opacity protein-like surface antigen
MKKLTSAKLLLAALAAVAALSGAAHAADADVAGKGWNKVRPHQTSSVMAKESSGKGW